MGIGILVVESTIENVKLKNAFSVRLIVWSVDATHLNEGFVTRIGWPVVLSDTKPKLN